MRITKEELKQIREIADVSQVQMSLILSYSQLHYHRIERGIYPVPSNILDILKPALTRYLTERVVYLQDQIEATQRSVEMVGRL